MEIEIREEPLTVTLVGVARERLFSEPFRDVVVPLHERLCEAVRSCSLLYAGAVWVLYESDARVFVGIEAGGVQGPDVGMEDRVLHLLRHAAITVMGDFESLHDMAKLMRTAILDRKYLFDYPHVQIMFDWDGDPARVEASLLYPVRRAGVGDPRVAGRPGE